MGYSADTREIDVIIPKDWLDEAYRRMCALNDRKELKRAGHRMPDGTWSSFAFMDENYPSRCRDAEDIFSALGFNTFYDEDMNLHIGDYVAEKLGDEELFFKTIADLVVGGGLVEWVGEDGEYWKWVFDGSGMEIKYGTVVYD